ncbi:MAG: hypothetical protein LC808_39995 [Actinobacteria bacterium]|nr:hypothetical protein [Actinomycetota bacterium]
MMVKQPPTEEALLQEALETIETRLPPKWSVEWTNYNTEGGEDRLLNIKSPNSSGRGLLVEVKRSLSPKEVTATFSPELVRRLRVVAGGTPIMVVAPFISPRSQELLAEKDISFLDLTGNIRLVLENPGLFIQTVGAAKNPYAEPRPTRGLRGAKAGLIIRTLIDVRPPYSVSGIADAAGVGAGYVSRVLETLESEALVTRGARGKVINVEWQELIRRRAAALDLLAPQTSKTYVSPNGARTALENLTGAKEHTVVTGSFAAVRLSPVAAPALLVAYSMRPDELASKLKLRPVSEGTDVVLVRPENPGVLRGAYEDDGLTWAAPSQIAIDCYSGSGRMPSEGQEIIQWMALNEDEWRVDSLDRLRPTPEWAPR